MPGVFVQLAGSSDKRETNMVHNRNQVAISYDNGRMTSMAMLGRAAQWTAEIAAGAL